MRTFKLLDIRVRAIWSCLYFGLLPWQFYEPRCHYRRGYFRHAWLNIEQAWKWITGRGLGWGDLRFERKVNPTWKSTLRNGIRRGKT